MDSASARAYEAHARAFLEKRDRSTIGVGLVEQWAGSLPTGCEVLEIACGGRIPVTRALAGAGLRLWAVDSSPTLVAEFKGRFPEVPVNCADALASDYFGRQFGAVVAIGLLFLLSEAEQVRLIQRVAEVLLPGGRFLFTAPVEVGSWADLNTGHECRSLGRERYEGILQEAQFRLLRTDVDEGRNNYYEVERV